jgi:cytochrome P450
LSSTPPRRTWWCPTEADRAFVGTFPVHSFSCQALAEDRIAGRHVPAKAVVIIAPWLLHRHRTLWDEPNRFDPKPF